MRVKISYAYVLIPVCVILFSGGCFSAMEFWTSD